MLIRNVKSSYLCLVLDLREKAVSFLLLNMMLSVGLLYMAFIMLGYIPSMPNLLRVFNHEGILSFVKCFYCLY